MAENYFIISVSGSDVYVTEHTKGDLLALLNSDDMAPSEFWDELPRGIDGNPFYWRGKQLLIKGQVVVPNPVDVVKEFEIE